MAGAKSTDKDFKLWLKIITDGEKSDLNAKEFCAAFKNPNGKPNPINTKTYSAWKARLVKQGHKFQASGVQRKPRGIKKSPRKVGKAKPIAANDTNVSTITPHFGAPSAEPAVNPDTLTITATLPNGVMLDLKCPSKKDLDSALKTLLQTLMGL